jgi:large subunit ribosomal protein L14
MISIGSVVNVIDNSGVREVRVIQVYHTSRFGKVGSTRIGAVVKVRPDSEFKKGDVVRGIRVGSKVGVNRRSGVRVRFPQNNIVLLNKKGEVIATRLLNTVPLDLRKIGQLKIISRAPSVV